MAKLNDGRECVLLLVFVTAETEAGAAALPQAIADGPCRAKTFFSLISSTIGSSKGTWSQSSLLATCN